MDTEVRLRGVLGVLAAPAISCATVVGLSDHVDYVGMNGGSEGGTGLDSNGPVDAQGASPEAAMADAPVRTGVRCGNESTAPRCAVGSICCTGPGSSFFVCSTDCSSVDGSATQFACWQQSDCPSGDVCCVSVNGGCFSYPVGSQCVPPVNCNFDCDAGGTQALACDPSSDTCPTGLSCQGYSGPESACRP